MAYFPSGRTPGFGYPAPTGQSSGLLPDRRAGRGQQPMYPPTSPSGYGIPVTPPVQTSPFGGGVPGSAGQPTDPSFGGPGSSVNIGPEGNVLGATLTPNLAPQQAGFQRQQTELEGQQATTRQQAELTHQAKQGTEAATSQRALQELIGGQQAALATQQSAAEQALLAQRASLGENAFQSRLKAVTGLVGQGGGSPMAPRESYGGNIAANEQGARSAAFARAKEFAGNNALAALKSVQGLTADRGLTGSTYEAGLLGDVIGGAAGQLGDYGREQYIQDLNRSADISDMQYQGNLAQRAQDVTQRGQDIARQQALLSLLNMGAIY